MGSWAELARETEVRDLSGEGKEVVARPSPFTTPDSPMPIFTTGEFIDEEALNNEIGVAIRAFEAARDNASGVKITISSTEEGAEHKQWQEQRAKVSRAGSFLTSVNNEYKEISERLKKDGKGVTTQEFCLYHARCVGTVFLIRDLLERQRQYAQKYGFAERVEPYLELYEFCNTSGEPSVRIGGVALKDFLSNEPKLRLPLSSLYSFLVESFMVRHKRSYEEILRDLVAQGYSWSVYPNITKQAIEGATAEAYALVNISPEQIDDLLRSSHGIAKESAQWTSRLYRRVQEVCQDYYQALLNPQLPEFPSVREAIRPYLQKGVYEKFAALYLAGLREDSRISQLYRKAQELSLTDNSDFEFYQFLAESIKDYADAIPPDENILTLDDLTAIFDEEVLLGVESREAPTLESLGTIAQATFSKSSVRDYEVNPQSVDWGGLIPPQGVRVEFNQDRPTKFRILLLYENEVGESLEVAFNFDTKRQQFDWNFIEAPGDARMAKFCEATLFASRSVLLRVQSEAEKHYEEKRERASGGQTETPTKKLKERFADESYSLRKKARAQVRAQAVRPAGLTIPEDVLDSAEIQKIILLPDDETLREKLKRLSSPDRQIAIKGIEKFNGIGVGEFRRKRRRGRDGSILYTLRINCSAPKGMRVLLRKLPPGNGVRRYEVLDIRYRHDIYQRAGI